MRTRVLAGVAIVGLASLPALADWTSHPVTVKIEGTPRGEVVALELTISGTPEGIETKGQLLVDNDLGRGEVWRGIPANEDGLKLLGPSCVQDVYAYYNGPSCAEDPSLCSDCDGDGVLECVGSCGKSHRLKLEHGCAPAGSNTYSYRYVGEEAEFSGRVLQIEDVGQDCKPLSDPDSCGCATNGQVPFGTIGLWLAAFALAQRKG